MNKKVIISLVMIGIMAFGAGLGTYAYFTAVQTSNDNQIQVGTLQLDGNYSDGENESFTGALISEVGPVKPGYSKVMNTIRIDNTGTLPMHFDAEATISGIIGTGTNVVGDMPGDKFIIYPDIKFNGSHFVYGYADRYGLYIDALDGTCPITVNEFEQVLQELFNGSNFILQPNDYLQIGGKFELKSSADNSYQGKLLDIDITFTGSQL